MGYYVAVEPINEEDRERILLEMVKTGLPLTYCTNLIKNVNHEGIDLIIDVMKKARSQVRRIACQNPTMNAMRAVKE